MAKHARKGSQAKEKAFVINEHYGDQKLEVLISEWLSDTVKARPDLLTNTHTKKSNAKRYI